MFGGGSGRGRRFAALDAARRGALADIDACIAWRNRRHGSGAGRLADRGRGHATEATRALVAWALGHHLIHRVELTAATGNLASQRVAEKAGFTFEGVARCGGVTHGGRVDLCVYALIRADLEVPRRDG